MSNKDDHSDSYESDDNNSDEESIDNSEQHDESEDDDLETALTELELFNQQDQRYIVVEPEKRRSSNLLTKYEMVELLNIRAKQIQTRNNTLTDTSELTTALDKAKKELADGKFPLILQREMGKRIIDGRLTVYVEYWDVNTMTHPELLE